MHLVDAISADLTVAEGLKNFKSAVTSTPVHRDENSDHSNSHEFHDNVVLLEPQLIPDATLSDDIDEEFVMQKLPDDLPKLLEVIPQNQSKVDSGAVVSTVEVPWAHPPQPDSHQNSASVFTDHSSSSMSTITAETNPDKTKSLQSSTVHAPTAIVPTGSVASVAGDSHEVEVASPVPSASSTSSPRSSFSNPFSLGSSISTIGSSFVGMGTNIALNSSFSKAPLPTVSGDIYNQPLGPTVASSYKSEYAPKGSSSFFDTLEEVDLQDDPILKQVELNRTMPMSRRGGGGSGGTSIRNLSAPLMLFNNSREAAAQAQANVLKVRSSPGTVGRGSECSGSSSSGTLSSTLIDSGSIDGLVSRRVGVNIGGVGTDEESILERDFDSPPVNPLDPTTWSPQYVRSLAWSLLTTLRVTLAALSWRLYGCMQNGATVLIVQFQDSIRGESTIRGVGGDNDRRAQSQSSYLRSSVGMGLDEEPGESDSSSSSGSSTGVRWQFVLSNEFWSNEVRSDAFVKCEIGKSSMDKLNRSC